MSPAMVRKILAERLAKLKKRPTARKKRIRPEDHVATRFGKGWHKRNFLGEVVLPSLFESRRGIHKCEVHFPELTGDQICVTWIGHASFLIQTREYSILIDPNWAKWLKVIKRIRHPGFQIHDLPAIDLVLVTHAHFDHLDRKTLRAVAANQPIVVPKHVGSLVKGLGFHAIHELDIWQSYQYQQLQITLTPAFHWGARMWHDSYRGFGGFIIEYRGRTLFHCGDSAYFEGFKEIGKRYRVDLALLPIGAYDPPTCRDVHMNPEQAIQAFLELGAQKLIPMHYGTFRLGYEPVDEPPLRLIKRANELGIVSQLYLLTEGQPSIF